MKEFVKWYKKQVNRPLTDKEKLQIMYWAFKDWEKVHKRYAVKLNKFGKYEPYTCYNPKCLGLFTECMTISNNDILPTNAIKFFDTKAERDKFLKDNREKSIFDEEDWGYTENYEDI